LGQGQNWKTQLRKSKFSFDMVNWASNPKFKPKPTSKYAKATHSGPRPKLYSSFNFGLSLFISPIKFGPPPHPNAET
jgi:hypothetical protein